MSDNSEFVYLFTKIFKIILRRKIIKDSPRWGSKVTAETRYQLTVHSGSNLTDHLSAVAVKKFQKFFQNFFILFLNSLGPKDHLYTYKYYMYPIYDVFNDH